jgi:hypothetical protein
VNRLGCSAGPKDRKEKKVKNDAVYGLIAASFVFLLCAAGPAVATHQGHGAPATEKKLFTKHFQQTLFDITTHADYSVEILLDDKEYPIGKDVIGVIIHNSHDEDVKGADLTIIQKELTTGENVPLKLAVTDKHNGLYIVSGLDLKRKGKWELLITVNKDGVQDSVAFVFPDALKQFYPKGRYSP